MSLVNPQKTFERAEKYHRQGKLKEAFKLYKSLHNQMPHETTLINLLAQINLQQQKHFEGIYWLEQSLKINLNQFLVHLNLGTAYFELKQFEKASESFERSIQINPQYALTYYNKGQSERNLERHQDALTSYNKAIQLNPQYAEAMNGIGRVYHALKLYDQELEAYQRALLVSPYYVEAYFNAGVACAELKKWDEAIQYYKKAAQIHPNYEQAYNNLGVALAALKRYGEAIVSYQKAISIKSKYPEAHNNMAVAYHNRYQYKEAEETYKKAIHIKPDYVEAYNHLGNLYADLQNWSNALDAYHQAIKINPEAISSYKYMALSYLASFRLREGWYYYEKRISEDEYKQLGLKELPIDQLISSNKNILILGEQGIGDEILYGSLLNELKEIYSNITVALDKRLVDLFSRSFADIHFIAKQKNYDEVNYDEYMFIGSLARFFRPDAESFNRQIKPYLEVDLDRLSKIRSTIGVKSPVIGIAWKSHNEEIGHNKSITLEKLLPILKLPNITFVDLQYGDVEEEKKSLFNEHGIQIISLKEIDNFNDIDGLASLIQACDIVISISNATVHIAGALSKKTYLLLPSTRGKLYYWHHINQDQKSMWYPSIEIRNQAITGEWNETINNLAKDLKEKIFND